MLLLRRGAINLCFFLLICTRCGEKLGWLAGLAVLENPQSLFRISILPTIMNFKILLVDFFAILWCDLRSI